MFIFFCFSVFLLSPLQDMFAAEDEFELMAYSPRRFSTTGEECEEKEVFTGTTMSGSAVEAAAEDEPLGLLPPELAYGIPLGPEVVRWLDTEVVNKKDPLSKCTNRGLLIFGSLSAIARGSVYFILGYKLSEKFFVSSVSSPWNHIVSALYGSAASVPMTFLGAASSQKFLKYLFTRIPQAFINIQEGESCFKKTGKMIGNTLLVVTAGCSASILTYIAYDNYERLIGWFWLVPGLPTFYIRTLIDFYAIKQIGNAAYDKLIGGPRNKKLAVSQPESRGADIHNIKELLRNARHFVKSLTFEQAKILENIVNSEEETVDQKIRTLINPASFIEDEVVVKENSWLREAAGYVGGAVAVCGMYLYYNGTKAAFGFTQPLFNLTENEANYTMASLAVFSLATASSLSAIAAHSSAQKFYDLASRVAKGSYRKVRSLFRGSEANVEAQPAHAPRTRGDIILMRKRAGEASLAFLLGCCDAGTLYELAVQQSLDMREFANALALVSSSVALFSMSFWAVDEALMYYVRGGDPKATILDLIDRIDKKLPSMSDTAVKALRQVLTANREAPQVA